MELKNKLKELRKTHNMTQETVADRLGVTSQTVSKWERGLLSPDISLLPKIALLFHCTIDSLFNMEVTWSVEHRREFEAKISELHAKQDWEGVYRAWMDEIRLNPDNYAYYAAVMNHVYRCKLCDLKHVEEMLALADHAEQCCTNDDIRNEIYRIMLQICSESKEAKIKEKRDYYYKKLPLLLHSREVYAKHALEGDAYRVQILQNTIRLIDLAECSIRQLIPHDAPPEEALFYYKKAAALYETILDGQYGGFYDFAMMYDYYQVAAFYLKLGQPGSAADYIQRIEETLERHLNETEKEHKSKLLYATDLNNGTSPEEMTRWVLRNMLRDPELEPFHERIREMQKRYNDYYSCK